MNTSVTSVDLNSTPHLIQVEDDLYALTFDLMKVTPAKYIIEAALRTGQITQDTTVVETTSGTLGLGLALVCHHHGLRLALVSDDAIRGPLLERIQDLGARVEIVTPRPGEGIQKTRMNKLRQLLALPNTFCPQQYDNPLNTESYRAIGMMVADRVPGTACIVGPVGSGGSLCGITAAIRETSQARDTLRSVAVDTPGSILFGLPDRPRKLRGLGNSLHPKNLRAEMIDTVYWVSYADAAKATRLLHSQSGIYAGPTSGAAYLAAVNDRQNHFMQGPTIFICPDRGDRYPEVYSPDHADPRALPEVPYTHTPEAVTMTAWTNWNRKGLN